MRKISFLGCLLVFVWISCTRDCFTPSGTDCDVAVSYETNMKDIVDRYCAYSGCHNGGTPGVPGDYTSYQGMEIHFDGPIFNRVVTNQADPNVGMPPDYAVDGPIDFTPEDFMLFNCWIDQEFPEN